MADQHDPFLTRLPPPTCSPSLPHAGIFSRGYYGGAVPFWSKQTRSFYDMHVNNGIETDPAALANTTYSQYVWQEGLDAFLR